MIRHIESFCPKFDRLSFANAELASQSHVDRNDTRPLQVERGITPFAVRGTRKGGRIQPAIDSFVGKIWIREYLICAIGTEARSQRCVETRRRREISAGLQTNDARKLPTARKQSNGVVGERRRFINRGQVDDVPQISRTTAATVTATAGIIAGVCLVAAGDEDISDCLLYTSPSPRDS